MLEFISEYGLFLAKALTVLVFIWILVSLLFSFSKKARGDDHFEVTHLNRKYKSLKDILFSSLLPKKELKKTRKQAKKEFKKERKKTSGEARKRVFVLNFLGNIKATAVRHLRKEVTAILSVASSGDEVVVCLESTGGLVHEHGFAASQLLRIKQKGIPLTVAVDKVAASGGYMMACVADKIIAAPFAVVGSIGVLAQLPNFNRMLDKHGIDFELMKAGELKRTMTMFGKNTNEDREHFNEQLEDTHALFKEFVKDHRPGLDIEKVATGEHWLASRALALNLVDTLMTSDDYLLEASHDADIYEISCTVPRTISERIAATIQASTEKLFFSWWQQDRDTRFLG
ncbi:MAG: protease SohB [Gammaproteobacteria bacterium]|nr:protease SohB [Gammaproteobacteria bacterium]